MKNPHHGYEFQTGIPIPPHTRNNKPCSPLTTALLDIPIGSSLLVTNKTLSLYKNPGGSIASATSYARKKLQTAKFVRRSVDGGVRIWRLQ